MADAGVQQLVAQMRTAEIRSVINQFVAAEGRFERKNVTEYLRRFDVAVKSLRLADAEVAAQFELTVHEDFDEQVREVTAGKTWGRAKEDLRETFRRFDETRVTVERFVAWIEGPKEKEDPDDILRGFDRRFGYLDATERAYFAEKTVWLLRAMPVAIRREAAKALREGDGLTSDWARVSDTVRTLARVNRVVRRVAEAPKPTTTEGTTEAAEAATPGAATTAAPARKGEVSELCERLERLSLNFIAAMERMQHSAGLAPAPRRWEPAAQGPGAAPRQARVCMWCDREGHLRRECEDLRQTLDRGEVRIDDRGLVCRPDLRPFPVGRPGTGGMKAVFIGERAGTVGRTNAIQLRAAEAAVRVQTVAVDEKRARQQGDTAERTKRARGVEPEWAKLATRAKTYGRAGPSTPGPTAVVSAEDDVEMRRSEPAAAAALNETAKRAVPAAEPAKQYELQTPVRKGDPEQLAVDAVLGAKATVDVATLLNVVPLSTLRAISQQLRTRRVAVQATRLDADGLDDEWLTFGRDESERPLQEETTRLAEARVDAIQVPRPEEPSRVDPGTWAWGCPRVEVTIPGLGRSVKALIDSGSEITVADARLAAEAKWLYDPRPNWQMCTAHGKSYLRGACPNVRLDVGDLATTVNLFIQDDLGYPLILGQTWLMAVRMGTQCRADGSEIAWISSPDGSKVRCWVAVDTREGRGTAPAREGPEAGRESEERGSEQDFRSRRSV